MACYEFDSCGFKHCTERMRGLTTSWANERSDDKRRFNLGIPKEAWRTMTRCWEIEPTSERIIADIMDFPNVLKIFIDHEGAVVTEMNFRHGQQAQAMNISLKLLSNNESNNNGLIYK